MARVIYILPGFCFFSEEKVKIFLLYVHTTVRTICIFWFRYIGSRENRIISSSSPSSLVPLPKHTRGSDFGMQFSSGRKGTILEHTV